MSPLYTAPLVLLAAGLALLVLSGLELGHRLGRSTPLPDRQLAAISAPTLALVGLLLGFSLGFAGDRHSARRAVLVQESNSIGTFWLRTSLLPEPARSTMRSRLRRYVDLHFEHRTAGIDARRTAALETEVARLQQQMWTLLMREAGGGLNGPSVLLLTPALNALIDDAASLVAARENRVPDAMLAFLFMLVFVASLVVGCSSRGERRSLALWLALVTVLGGVLVIVIDMDRPRRGLIRTEADPLLRLRQSLQAE